MTGTVNWFWKGYKPNSVFPALPGSAEFFSDSRKGWGENHLSEQPVPGIHPLSRNWSGPLRDPLFGLAPDGVCRASALALGAVVSYTTFSPLSHRSGTVYFLWHFPSRHLSVSSPACIPDDCRGYAASRPAVFGLSSPPNGGAILHPSKTAETIDLGRLTGKGTRQVVECKTQAATGKTL